MIIMLNLMPHVTLIFCNFPLGFSSLHDKK
jgi:hypothetical protein